VHHFNFILFISGPESGPGSEIFSEKVSNFAEASKNIDFDLPATNCQVILKPINKYKQRVRYPFNIVDLKKIIHLVTESL
jgi:hypothetical protein